MAEAANRPEKGKAMSMFTKKAKRVRQKVLQKVGQAEKTTDDCYTEFVVNFHKQQLAASRLQKELIKYNNSIKALSQNTKSLTDLWLELYDTEWKGYNDVQTIAQEKMTLWEEMNKQIQSDLVEPLQLYMSKFPEAKKLVEKRERKIVDYDYAKRELDAARQNKKMTEVKLQQLEEAYQEAKRTFDEVTDVVYEELPALFDSRIEFYSTFFCNMTSLESKFHGEMHKLDENYNGIMTQLLEEAQSGVHTSKKERVASDIINDDLNPIKNTPLEEGSYCSSVASVDDEDDSSNHGGNTSSSGKVSPSGQAQADIPPKPIRSNSTITRDSLKENDTEDRIPQLPEEVEEPSKTEANVNTTDDDNNTNTVNATEESTTTDTTTDTTTTTTTTTTDVAVPVTNVGSSNDNEELPSETTEVVKESQNDIPAPNDTPIADEKDDIPNDDNHKSTPVEILYKVKAFHPYEGDDEDELSFEKGDIISVIPFDNPDDEEEGWLMGWIETTNGRGVFPKNFTVPYP